MTESEVAPATTEATGKEGQRMSNNKQDTALAVIEHESAADIESRIMATRQWLTADAAPSELAAAIKSIKVMSEWLRIAQAASELRVQALTLEYIALRRIGGTEFITDLPNTQLRAAARWLSTLSDEVFATLVDAIGQNYSPIAAYRAHLKAETKKREQARVEEIGGGGGLDTRYAWRGDTLRQATTVILDEMIALGTPFKTSEVAQRLADELDIEGTGLTREEIGKALVGVVTTAVQHGGDQVRDVLIGDDVVRMPRVVTIIDDEFGWMRIPFFNASLGQLLAMAEDNEVRAQNAVAKATELRKLANHYEAFGQPNENLAEIDRRAREARKAAKYAWMSR